jgi:hypothetical protein
MAISLVVIAKAYSSGLRNLIARPIQGQRLGKKRAQPGECRLRRHRLRGAPHRPARRRVQHPQRKLLDPSRRHPVKAAARHSRAAALKHLVNANHKAEPAVPGVGDNRLIAQPDAVDRFMGVVS